MHNNLQKYASQFKQEMINEMIDFLFSRSKISIILVDKPRLRPNSKEDIAQILNENHSSSVAGHSGFQRTYKRIKENYKWPNMKLDIKKYIKQCESCQKNKSSGQIAKAPMEITTTSDKPFQRLALDVVGPLPMTESGNRFIITMQDDLTKYSHAVSVPNHEAKTIANVLLNFICQFGIPESILTDQGSDFTSNVIKDLNRLFKIRHILSSPYHPQTNGALERSHSTLKEYLKHYINTQQSNWDEYVPLAMFTYNTHFHKSTHFTPFELIFGNKAHIPNSLNAKPEFRYTYEDYYNNLKLKLNQSFQIARENIIKSKENSKIIYDRKIKQNHYKIGDCVYLENKIIKPGTNKKLLPKFKGPFKIVGINDNQTVKLLMNNNKINTYHHNLLKPFVSEPD